MRFPAECCQIHQTLRQAMPHLSETQTKGFVLWGARNDNRPKRMSDRRRRQTLLHRRILRRPTAPPRVALRWRGPLHPVPESDRRPRPLRAADEMGLVAVEVQRPRARHRPDDALRQALRHSRERGLSRMRHPGRVGRPARQQARQVDSPHGRAARTAVCRHSQRNEGNRDDGPRLEKPESVEKDTLVQLASVHATVHKHDFPPRKRDADARAQAVFRFERLLHQAGNGVQGVVETASGNDNRHLGRGSGAAVDRA